MDEMLIPGQVENWIAVNDMNKKGLGSLSVSNIKKILNMLQANYRCRLGMGYIINPPKSFSFIWSVAKPFMDASVIAKTRVSKGSTPHEMLQICSPHQVEEKYGGRAPNLTEYWPPCMHGGPWTNPEGVMNGQHSGPDTYAEYFVENPQRVSVEEHTKSIVGSVENEVVRSENVSLDGSSVYAQEISEESVCFSSKRGEETDPACIERLSIELKESVKMSPEPSNEKPFRASFEEKQEDQSVEVAEGYEELNEVKEPHQLVKIRRESEKPQVVEEQIPNVWSCGVCQSCLLI